MLDPRLLYQFNPQLWESLRGSNPVMLHFLDGYIDAGRVGRTLATHILATCEHEVLVDFDVDQLHDYRSRRPVMVFDVNKWKSVEEVSLRIHRVTDPAQNTFLVLEGPEPDVQWMRTASAMVDLVERLDVRLALTAYGIPMAVPHTRPTLITQHGTDSSLVPDDNPVWMGRLEIPGSFAALLELSLGRRERSAVGLALNVPHYLAQAPFHQAAVAGLRRINELGGLAIPEQGLTDMVATNLTEIAHEMEDSAEVQSVVSGLEEQYDQNRAQDERPIPSADEIGAELEKFLADRDRKDDDGR